MKVTIAYLPGEEREADILKRAAASIMEPVKVRESDRHPPFKHIYLSTRKPENRCSSKENT